VDGTVLMYADSVTDSMKAAISETQRRRQIQIAYNTEHGIDPQTIRKKVTDILLSLRGADQGPPTPRKGAAKAPGAPRDADRGARTPDPGLEEEMHQAAKDLGSSTPRGSGTRSSSCARSSGSSARPAWR
jgi:excinuclease ABC subunit B